MASTDTIPLHCRAEIGIFPCSKCRKPMRLTSIESAATGYDTCTFECSLCNTTRKFSVAI